MLYQALKIEPPKFAHLPMILGPDRSKLSKRHDAVSLLEYREQGYLAEAMVNFLSLLGWSLDDKTELLSRQEIIDNFSLKRINRTGAVFNRDKLDWMNGIYIRKLSDDEFFEAAQPYLMTDAPAAKALISDEQYVRNVLPLAQERARRLIDLVELTRFFFVDKLDYDVSLISSKETLIKDTIKVLETSQKRLSELAIFSPEELEITLRIIAADSGMKTGQFFSILRATATGRIAAPPLFTTMSVLGKDRCLARIQEALNRLLSLT
jgi:glutamyl-tRNA synthetase